jgi:hypothetical protein
VQPKFLAGDRAALFPTIWRVEVALGADMRPVVLASRKGLQKIVTTVTIVTCLVFQWVIGDDPSGLARDRHA